MITIITTIIVSILLGVISPIVSPGVNLSGQNLFSQITSQLPTKNLSEVNPINSLNNATAPLNAIWKALGDKLNIQGLDSIKDFVNGQTDSIALKSSLGSGLGVQDTSTTMWQVLGIAKSAFMLAANILVAVLEIVLWLLKGVLGLINQKQVFSI